MSAPRNYDLPPIVRGDDWKFAFRRLNPYRTPFDFTGCAARMHFRDSGDRLVTEFSTAAGSIALGGEDGTFVCALGHAVTSAIKAPRLRYDLEFTYSDGTIKTYLSGTVPVIYDETR